VPSPSLPNNPLFSLLSPVGEDLLADTLTRYLKAKGVEVELRQEKKGQSSMAGFRASNGNQYNSFISVLYCSCGYIVRNRILFVFLFLSIFCFVLFCFVLFCFVLFCFVLFCFLYLILHHFYNCFNMKSAFTFSMTYVISPSL
jgi:hypothetical protein